MFFPQFGLPLLLLSFVFSASVFATGTDDDTKPRAKRPSHLCLVQLKPEEKPDPEIEKSGYETQFNAYLKTKGLKQSSEARKYVLRSWLEENPETVLPAQVELLNMSVRHEDDLELIGRIQSFLDSHYAKEKEELERLGGGGLERQKYFLLVRKYLKIKTREEWEDLRLVRFAIFIKDFYGSGLNKFKAANKKTIEFFELAMKHDPDSKVIQFVHDFLDKYYESKLNFELLKQSSINASKTTAEPKMAKKLAENESLRHAFDVLALDVNDPADVREQVLAAYVNTARRATPEQIRALNVLWVHETTAKNKSLIETILKRNAAKGLRLVTSDEEKK